MMALREHRDVYDFVFVQRTGSENPFDGIDARRRIRNTRFGDLDGDGTLGQCPLIDILRPHLLSQATWTSCGR